MDLEARAEVLALRGPQGQTDSLVSWALRGTSHPVPVRLSHFHPKLALRTPQQSRNSTAFRKGAKDKTFPLRTGFFLEITGWFSTNQPNNHDQVGEMGQLEAFWLLLEWFPVKFHRSQFPSQRPPCT